MPSRADGVLSTFFAAMQEGYAKGAKKEGIADLPGSKAIPFVRGEFKLLDFYFVTPESPFSFGQTVVWWDNTPVWVMSYQGWYPKDVIPFLKQALSQAYEKRSFFGGRGPRFFTDGKLIYMNDVESPNDWRRFRGREKILGCDGSPYGWHEYQGLYLLD